MSTEREGIWQRAVDPWWDSLGLAGAVILGVVLFFFPEPATSVLGTIIIVAAALIWLGVDLRQEVKYTSRSPPETEPEE